MKLSTITLSLTAFLATSALAVPAPSSELITALVSSGKLAAVLKKEKSPIGKLEIEPVSKYDATIESLCGNVLAYRSSSVVKVEVIYRKNTTGDAGASVYSSTHYFATDNKATDLEYCKGV